MKFIVVELDDGEQQFFDTSYDGFKYAKIQEDARTHSVEYVAIGAFETEDDHIIFYGQELRNMLRSLDNINGWLRAGQSNDNLLQGMD